MRHLLPALALLGACATIKTPTDSSRPPGETGSLPDSGSAAPDCDGDGYPDSEDCDPCNAQVNPGTEEVCDGIDNNCDGQIDEGVLTTSYADADGDGFGDDTTAEEACSVAAGRVAVDGDCDDADPYVYAGAEEICDGLDNDCNGLVDEGLDVTGYEDGDGDGYGDPETAYTGCELPFSYVLNNGDCDDEAASVNPAAPEICDGLDNDCDGRIDEDGAIDAPTWYEDLDGDGYGDPAISTVTCTAPSDSVGNDADCDDRDPAISPAGIEVCDGVDNNCDGEIDESTATDAATWYADRDADGYGDPGTPTLACDVPDGFVADDTDCDDTDAAVSPVGTEVCNGIDDDCDGEIDEIGAVDAGTWYADADGDGYGDISAATVACDAPTGTVANALDCDDTNRAISPSGVEICDGKDNDCDGEIDEDSAVGAPIWYADADGDGYGALASSAVACDAPPDYVSDHTDCNDANADVSPAGIEVCNGIDDDCDGAVDEDSATDVATWYDDADRDGYGDPDAATVACDEPPGTVADDTDCDDGASTIYPGAPEICDGLDDDCDGEIDEGVLGSSTACPALNCEEIIEDRPSAPDGTYTIDPTGSGTPFTVKCEMTIDDGGWTQLSSSYLSMLSTGVSREYLYTYSTGFYVSPDTTSVWSWSKYTAVAGTYSFGKGDSITGTFTCSSVEAGYWGIGCSNSPGSAYKCLPWGSSHDTTSGLAEVCQDKPDVFGVGACAYPAQIWVRP